MLRCSSFCTECGMHHGYMLPFTHRLICAVCRRKRSHRWSHHDQHERWLFSRPVWCERLDADRLNGGAAVGRHAKCQMDSGCRERGLICFMRGLITTLTLKGQLPVHHRVGSLADNTVPKCRTYRQGISGLCNPRDASFLVQCLASQRLQLTTRLWPCGL